MILTYKASRGYKIRRELPEFNVPGGLRIGYVDSLSDPELVYELSKDMFNHIESEIVTPELNHNYEFYSSESNSAPVDSGIVMITAETKGIPYAFNIASMFLAKAVKVDVVVARKSYKSFFGDASSVTKDSITSEGKPNKLYLADYDRNKLIGKKIIIVDDIYSTGESMRALETLAEGLDNTIVDRVVGLIESFDKEPEFNGYYSSVLKLKKSNKKG